MEEVSCYANIKGKECVFCKSKDVEVDEVLVSILKEEKISVRIYFYCKSCEEQFFLGIKED